MAEKPEENFSNKPLPKDEEKMDEEVTFLYETTTKTQITAKGGNTIQIMNNDPMNEFIRKHWPDKKSE